MTGMPITKTHSRYTRTNAPPPFWPAVLPSNLQRTRVGLELLKLLMPPPAEDFAEATATDDDAVIAGTLRVPRRWQRLLVDAAVLGGEDLDIDDREIRLPGFALPVSLDIPDPYS